MKAESNLEDFEKMKKEFKDLEGRYASAIELLGEREEQVYLQLFSWFLLIVCMV